MKRIVSVILAAAVLMLALAGCAPRAEISVIALKGPTGMGMAYLMEGQGQGKYSIDLTNMPDDISGLVASGNVDIAAVPVNMASALYNRLDGGVRIIAVNTLGVMYVLENGNAINSLEDLRGGTLYATGQAATPQYILDYLLEKNGLSGDVTVEYYQDHAELSALLASGRVSVGMLPEPNVTATLMSNADIRVALDITELWRGACQTELVQGCIIVRKEFLEKHKEDHLYFFTTKGRKVYSEQTYPDDSYLIFGREDAGIDEEILVHHPDTCLRLPMIGPVRSLNLSNTVAIAVYETLRQWGFPALQNEGQLHRLSWDQINQTVE